MRWQLKEVYAHVNVHLLLAVDIEVFIRVDRHQESSNVGLQRKTRRGSCVLQLLHI